MRSSRVDYSLKYKQPDLKRFTLSISRKAIVLTNRAICELSIKDHYVVVTKDADFVESFLLRRVPWKLLLISTGNIENDELELLLLASLKRLADTFVSFDFIELDRTNMIIHV